MDSSTVLRVALFGLGRAGRIHLGNLIENDNFVIRYVVEMKGITNPHVPSDAEYIDATDDAAVEAVLADPELDAVVVASPTHTHVSIAMRALRANKHTFVEKPLAESVEDIKVGSNLVRTLT